MRVPDGMKGVDSSTHCLRVVKALYGLPQSSQAGNKLFDKELRNLGFNKSKMDWCLYFRKEKDGTNSYIGLFVDDCIIASKHKEIIEGIVLISKRSLI